MSLGLSLGVDLGHQPDEAANAILLEDATAIYLEDNTTLDLE